MWENDIYPVITDFGMIVNATKPVVPGVVPVLQIFPIPNGCVFTDMPTTESSTATSRWRVALPTSISRMYTCGRAVPWTEWAISRTWWSFRWITMWSFTTVRWTQTPWPMNRSTARAVMSISIPADSTTPYSGLRCSRVSLLCWTDAVPAVGQWSPMPEW